MPMHYVFTTSSHLQCERIFLSATDKNSENDQDQGVIRFLLRLSFYFGLMAMAFEQADLGNCHYDERN
jgi:hypothetical protein